MKFLKLRLLIIIMAILLASILATLSITHPIALLYTCGATFIGFAAWWAWIDSH